MTTPEPKTKGPASYFPSIEKTCAKPMAHWFALVDERRNLKHMEIVNWLKAEHGMVCWSNFSGHLDRWNPPGRGT